MERVPMTKRGAEALREELQSLKGTRRHEIVRAIEEARAHGDLSENAEYHAAKEDQGMNESRISQLEDKLARAQVIDTAALDADKIVFGANVKLLDAETEKEVTYQIVGEDEADLSQGKISITSPIARALIGKSEGDEALVRAPGGEREYEIVSVWYA